VTRHSIPWDVNSISTTLANDRWELYHVDRDFSQADDLAAREPAKLRELQQKFDEVAVANLVYPLDDRRTERFDFRAAGRPDLMNGRKTLTVYPGMTGMMENAFINVKGVPHRITAEIEVPANGADGAIIAQGGRFGGWTLFMNGGKPAYEYNWFGQERTRAIGTEPLAPGMHVITVDYTPDAAKPGAGGRAVLAVNGRPVAEGRIPQTVPGIFSADEGADVGVDNETPVSDLYPEEGNAFTGTIRKVTIALK
jgi:arylsulfatase